MRKSLIVLSLLVGASPAFAQAAPAAGPVSSPMALPPQLTDPATVDHIANVMQALSQAFLDLPVGQVQAAVEGRRPTPAERHMTVGDIARRDDPNFDRKFERQMAEVRPMMHQSVKALNDAMPAMMQGLQQAARALERAAANMPDPNYPKR